MIKQRTFESITVFTTTMTVRTITDITTVVTFENETNYMN